MILIFVRCRSSKDTGSIGHSACCLEYAAAAYPYCCSAQGPGCVPQRLRRIPPSADGGCLEALSSGGTDNNYFVVQSSAKRRGLGCVNSLPGSAWL